ncbi:unnamed protein product [Oikopleura dioica]|uniref:Uncharacterized protein n=1 Tax=Oikopleura dioica TaxID=34765 RepID=E4Z5X3_OIKDI|nr:unnamed protein product [Oikopleura dioica]
MKENFILAIVAGPAILYLFRIIYSVSAGYDLMEPKEQLKSQTRNSDNLFEELINEWKSPTRKPLHQKHKQPRSALENLYQRAVPRESFIISSTRPSELLGHTNLVSWNVTYETVIKLASEGPLFLRQNIVDPDCCRNWPYDFYKLPFSRNETIKFNHEFLIVPWIGELNYVIPLQDLYKMEIYYSGVQAQTVYDDDLGNDDDQMDFDEDEYTSISRNHIALLQHLYSELVHLYDDINEAPPAGLRLPLMPNAIIWEGRVKILRTINVIAVSTDNLAALEDLEILWRILFLELDEKFQMQPPIYWQEEYQRIRQLLLDSENDYANPERFENI